VPLSDVGRTLSVVGQHPLSGTRLPQSADEQPGLQNGGGVATVVSMQQHMPLAGECLLAKVCPTLRKKLVHF
jgi:hypothetical protein